MASLTGENGIIGRASDSKTESRAAKVQDRVEMWKEASYADNWLDNDTEKDRDAFIDELASEGLLIGDEVETAKTNPYTVTIGSKTISFSMESSNSGDSGDGKETISTSTSYIGYYADIEGDGTVDGIIYADLALDGSGEYGTNGNGTYSWSKVTSGLKNYYVSQQNYEGYFGVADVLSPTGSGTDRFYIMALENFTTSSNKYFTWYYSAYNTGMSDYATATSTDFGTGKANTNTMISKWNSSSYGSQNSNSSYPDIWGVIQEEVAKGWFVPSRGELVAYADAFDLGLDYYSKYRWHWSSSQADTTYAWFVSSMGDGSGGLDGAEDGKAWDYTVRYNGGMLRLSTTF